MAQHPRGSPPDQIKQLSTLHRLFSTSILRPFLFQSIVLIICILFPFVFLWSLLLSPRFPFPHIPPHCFPQLFILTTRPSISVSKIAFSFYPYSLTASILQFMISPSSTVMVAIFPVVPHLFSFTHVVAEPTDRSRPADLRNENISRQIACSSSFFHAGNRMCVRSL